jgi:hypothetical protein
MRTRLIGMGALALLLGACGGSGSGAEGANGAKLTNNVAATAQPGGSDAQARVKALPDAQRNGVLIRAIRDANLACQQVTESSLSQTSNKVPVYFATCEDGAVYAVALADDGTATVQPVTPARGR